MPCKECGKPKCNCGKDRCSSPAAVQINNPAEVVNFRKVVVPASVGDETTNPPKVGAYSNVILQYEATGTTYIYSSECIPTLISDFSDIAGLWKAIGDEETAREAADQEIWQEIETIEASSDVVDVVGTYAELQQYDTSKLHNNDLIKVLADETHDDAITYYRWNKLSSQFTYVGAEGPYYTCSETDVLLSGKQNTLIAGANITINGDTISATNTTFAPYPSGVATTGTTSQFISSIQALNADAGTAFLGTVSLSDLPAGLIQEEVIAYVYDNNLIYLNLRSADTAPYEWWCASYDYQGWQPTGMVYTAGSNIQINGSTISATDTTYSAFTGATSLQAGAAGLVPAPATTDVAKYLKGDGTWATVDTSSVTYLVWEQGEMLDEDHNQISGDYVWSAYLSGAALVEDSTNATSGLIVSTQLRDSDTKECFLTVYNNNGSRTFVEYVYDSSNSSWSSSSQVAQGQLTAGSNISIATVNNVPNTISVTGMPVLYGAMGQNTDGAVTQKFFTDTVGDIETILQTLNSGAGV